MARRGAQLREHILWTAKDVFLELGFERASMDVVAGRAETSKRSLYAHFESKERLFLAVIDLVRGLFLGRLKMPGDHAAEPAEALALFCGRYLGAMLYEPSVQMMRITMAEAARFPEAAAQYFDVLFAEVRARLAAHLGATFGLPDAESGRAAEALLGQTLYPRLPRVLFGIDPPGRRPDGETVDLEPIRSAVADLLATLRSAARAGP